jgi:hypothetical protein
VQSNSLSMEWFVCDMYTEGKAQGVRVQIQLALR